MAIFQSVEKTLSTPIPFVDPVNGMVGAKIPRLSTELTYKKLKIWLLMTAIGSRPLRILMYPDVGSPQAIVELADACPQ